MKRHLILLIQEVNANNFLIKFPMYSLPSPVKAFATFYNIGNMLKHHNFVVARKFTIH